MDKGTFMVLELAKRASANCTQIKHNRVVISKVLLRQPVIRMRVNMYGLDPAMRTIRSKRFFVSAIVIGAVALSGLAIKPALKAGESDLLSIKPLFKAFDNNEMACEQRSWCLYQERKYNDAYKVVCQYRGKPGSMLKNIKALCLLHMNNVDQSISILQSIANRRDCLYMANLAYAYTLNNEDEKAWKISEELRSHYELRTVSRINFVRGLLEEKRGNTQAALDHFSTSIHTADFFPDSVEAMASLDYKLGYKKQADELTKALHSQSTYFYN
jgi:hypothetical protein